MRKLKKLPYSKAECLACTAVSFSGYLFSSSRKPFSRRPGQHALQRFAVRGAQRMQMNAARQVAQRPRVRVRELAAEGVRIVAREDMQRRRDLSVDRVLDRNIDDRAAPDRPRCKAPLSGGRRHGGRPRGTRPAPGRRRGFRGHSRAASRARRVPRTQQRHIADDDLAADAAARRERRRRHRCVRRCKQFCDFSAPFGCIHGISHPCPLMIANLRRRCKEKIRRKQKEPLKRGSQFFRLAKQIYVCVLNAKLFRTRMRGNEDVDLVVLDRAAGVLRNECAVALDINAAAERDDGRVDRQSCGPRPVLRRMPSGQRRVRRCRSHTGSRTSACSYRARSRSP